MKERYTAEQLHARMVATVGVLLGVTFFIVVVGFVGGLLFISQPLEQSPNDKEFISLMTTIVTFLSGTLAGLVASNGMKDKPKE
jgi:ABC-type transporter Mla maintaining outer membrane lipid asymmetry permease subunit MlaE